MLSLQIGKNIKQPSGFKAFIPDKFPPKDLSLTNVVLRKNEQAVRLLGKLDGITKLLPDVDFFLLMYLRKDAASSSQIEGTGATMIDAIEASAGERISSDIPDDVNDILHYIQALNYGIKRVVDDNFPVSLRFLKELHQKLMYQARVTHFSDPGEFRRSQNWIGGTNINNARFVPPPVAEMNDSLSDLEKFIHCNNDGIPIVIKAALLHAQFETIHPFLDGNGRTGRMLITFYFWQEGFLERPVLFLSSFFKKHQNIYYNNLSGYSDGKVLEWVEFFLDGVILVSNEAIETVKRITILREEDNFKIQKLGKRASESAALILPKLYAQPVINVSLAARWTGFTRAGAQRVIDRFVEMGILIPKNKDSNYGQSYMYKKYLDIFSE